VHSHHADRTQLAEDSNLCIQARTATASKENFRAGSHRACAHDGHAQAWRTHALNIDANTKDFVDVDFVDINGTGNLRASGQCRCMDMGKSGVAAVHHGAFAMEACRTPGHSLGRKSFLSRVLVAATYWVRSGREHVNGAAWSATL